MFNQHHHNKLNNYTFAFMKMEKSNSLLDILSAFIRVIRVPLNSSNMFKQQDLNNLNTFTYAFTQVEHVDKKPFYVQTMFGHFLWKFTFRTIPYAVRIQFKWPGFPVRRIAYALRT